MSGDPVRSAPSAGAARGALGAAGRALRRLWRSPGSARERTPIDREVERLIARTGGKFTDSLEVEVARRMRVAGGGRAL
ncbi:hypothetical protein OPKNFCMD_6101 [Methylobacterium crusticola]|uniref:Uncharacterized protein n=1 Tax=Methylobacterium crusticola TaxID=1697972 RepID=A0ABQ4R6K9_9HYPH|nr:hypothetical protein [Methylobacterium crusticola]GJD53326.1 hypothetical protein OPKNFCMD_6101 [Methylobacterium crusticola]